MATSVQKTKREIPVIPGTKPSIKNAQLLISTGIPSLDHVIGGGLPIGSIMLIEEDTYGSYAKIMLEYFMAEGIVSSHSLFVGSQDVKSAKLISEIPAVATNSQASSDVPNLDEQMKIAWRYQNMKIIDASPTGGQVFGHFYDLSKPMERNVIKQANITQWDGEYLRTLRAESFKNNSYADLLEIVLQTIKKGEFFISDTPKKRNILRIAIHSLGSRLWWCDTEEDTHKDLLHFLYCFRALLRRSYAIATITVPFLNFNNDDAVVERMEHLADTAIRLETFVGSEKGTDLSLKNYHGLLHVKKLSALNTLAPHVPDSTDLAFKLRRKKFIIEVLHLPPELEDTTQREQDDIFSTGGCSGATKKSQKLDF